MPRLVRIFRQLATVDLCLSVLVEKANLDLGCVIGKDREVGAFAVPRGAARMGKSFLHLAGHK
jgi:hypothetical protein